MQCPTYHALNIDYLVLKYCTVQYVDSANMIFQEKKGDPYTKHMIGWLLSRLVDPVSDSCPNTKSPTNINQNEMHYKHIID